MFDRKIGALESAAFLLSIGAGAWFLGMGLRIINNSLGVGASNGPEKAHVKVIDVDCNLERFRIARCEIKYKFTNLGDTNLIRTVIDTVEMNH